MHPAMRGRIEQLADYHDMLAQRAKDEHETKQKLAKAPTADASKEEDQSADSSRRVPRSVDKPKEASEQAAPKGSAPEEPQTAEQILSTLHADVARDLRDLLKSQPPAPVIRDIAATHPERPQLR